MKILIFKPEHGSSALEVAYGRMWKASEPGPFTVGKVPPDGI